MTADNSKKLKKVAILIEQNVEDSEFQVPYQALQEAGAQVQVLGARMNEEYRGKSGKVSIKPDATTAEARPREFDAVVIPGGGAPDKMRTNRKTVRFVKEAAASGKLIAAICHGPQLLIEADLLRGCRVTGYRAIRKDIENAGGTYIDEPLAIDTQLITSRQPGDLPIFTTAILSRLQLEIPDRVLPDENDSEAQWWQLGEAWGGSSKNEIVEGLNKALAGERYTQEAFRHYADKTEDAATSLLLREIAETKGRHLELLEQRIRTLGGQPAIPSFVGEALATLTSWLPSSNDLDILRRALGDLQTGAIDAAHLASKYTDPVSTMIFATIANELAHAEYRVVELYDARLGIRSPEPAKPTTGVAV
jgi:protease I